MINNPSEVDDPTPETRDPASADQSVRNRAVDLRQSTLLKS